MGELRWIWRWWDALAATASAVDARPAEADLSVPVGQEEVAAEWRWSKSNEVRRQLGCPCGQPAQVAKPYPVMGTVPYLWWTCEDHAGVEMFSSITRDGITQTVACFKHPHPCPLGDDHGSSGKIGEPPTDFYCIHRDH
jgi:hypothetical protein